MNCRIIPYTIPVISLVLIVACMSASEASIPPVPCAKITAPVVHTGKYHILNAGGTYVVLDRTRGMCIALIGQAHKPDDVGNPSTAALEDMSVHVSTVNGGVSRDLDQVHAPDASLRIIAQAQDYAAARVFFSICESDGIPRGNGTVDIYVYPGRVFLIPSLFLEYEPGGTTITNAEFYTTISGKHTELEIDGTRIKPKNTTHFALYGDNDSGFNILITDPERPSVKMGWLRNRYSNWMYLNEIDKNPEVEELYEKWPPYITQRHSPNNPSASLAWNTTPSSGLLARYSETGLNRLSFAWVNKEPVEVPTGRYAACNGVMGVFLDASPARVDEQWYNHEHPVKPIVQTGDFRYYNEFEGVYEIDSKGGNVDATFGSSTDIYDRTVFARIWNLTGKGGYEVTVDGKPASFGLMNDGDLVEDPLVSIDHDVIQASGPARFATVEFTVRKGMKTRLALTRKPGIQLTYQMYSNMERYEAWSDACVSKPLFSVYLRNGNIYNATWPGGEDYAFYMYNLYWPGSPRPARTPNNVRGFIVHENGPDTVSFTFESTDPLGTALSDFTITVPYQLNRLTLQVHAQFVPEGDGKRWPSFEICNVYPFDTVYRRNFHLKDYFFLTKDGMFDRMGTGAWGGRFTMALDPEHLGYYAQSQRREGPGSHTPGSSDGTVWIFGSNPKRGNVLFRLGDYSFSPGSVLSLGICNAWVDINNNLNRKELSAAESINYTLEIFGGEIPSLDTLNDLYHKASGGNVVKQITEVLYTPEGRLKGFVTK